MKTLLKVSALVLVMASVALANNAPSAPSAPSAPPPIAVECCYDAGFNCSCTGGMNPYCGEGHNHCYPPISRAARAVVTVYKFDLDRILVQTKEEGLFKK